MNVLSLLRRRFRDALTGFAADPGPYAAMVKPVQDPKHGDYQANCAMSLGKALGRPPKDVAAEIVGRLDLGDLLEKPEIAGPGFINLRLRQDWLAARLRENAADARLGVRPVDPPRTYVVDFSSPNVAKPMHVGHLRSTIIGDTLARLLTFLGHHVITDNHLGDWGLQFGMLLYGYKHFRDDAALATDPVHEMVRLYVRMRELIKPVEAYEEAAEEARRNHQGDELRAVLGKLEVKYPADGRARADEYRAACRAETARLHAGDAENLRLWRLFMPWCMAEIEPVYRRLGVRFDHTYGESFYNPMLAEVVEDLVSRGLAGESEGALVVRLDPKAVGAENQVAIVQNSHEGYTYTTTDLATIRFRMTTWNPAAILYVVDARQGLHFKGLFDVARRWGYDRIELQHIGFGTICGPDGKPIKTRDGGAIELTSLLDEAVQRANEVYTQLRDALIADGIEVEAVSPEEQTTIAEVVGLGAIKYADLSQNRTSDYKFSWEKMLAMNGNTATYMQYAYARTRSIFRKAGEDPATFAVNPPTLTLGSPEERAVAVQLMRLEETLADAGAEYKPNLITAYLWDLAKAANGFYQNCPVLKAETPDLRRSRLLVCELIGRTIRTCLDLLGISTVERM